MLLFTYCCIYTAYIQIAFAFKQITYSGMESIVCIQFVNMSMYTFGPKLEYLVYILMFAYSMCTNDKLYVCKLHSDFCKGDH